MLHQYPLPRQALPQLVRSLAQMGTKRLKQVANLSGSRIQTLPGAAALLSATVRKLGASQVVISAWCLREGLLYQQLDPDVQALDPLIDTLLPQPFESTAVTGFGFLQIVRRSERTSLTEQVRLDPVANDAALLLSQAAR